MSLRTSSQTSGASNYSSRIPTRQSSTRLISYQSLLAQFSPGGVPLRTVTPIPSPLLSVFCATSSVTRPPFVTVRIVQPTRTMWPNALAVTHGTIQTAGEIMSTCRTEAQAKNLRKHMQKIILKKMTPKKAKSRKSRGSRRLRKGSIKGPQRKVTTSSCVRNAWNSTSYLRKASAISYSTRKILKTTCHAFKRIGVRSSNCMALGPVT